ncbi:A/G-specific adenine glycosylase [bacterium]|nr:A/G-specific adenine glycosylase [bacterium]
METAFDLLRMPDDPAFAARLDDWFAGVRRDLPWRDGDDLYGIWISEIMLQQTTVQAVVPYWIRFMERFPSVAALAAAPESDVLAAWAGLGYYSRARNLHAAARCIVGERRGVWPANRDEWSALPGVGPYASGAIASLGLGERVPALDANARRVLARWAVTDPDAWAACGEAERRRAVDDLGTALVPAAAPGPWNEALMELGALVCRARDARCRECPVAGSCRAGRGGWADRVPPPRPPRRPEEVGLALLVVRWRDRVFLEPPSAGAWPSSAPGRRSVRDDFSGLHRGLWGLPTTAWWSGPDVPAVPWGSVADRLDLPDAMGPAGGGWETLGTVRHGITRYRLQATVLGCELPARAELPARLRGDSSRWRASRPGAPGCFAAPADGLPPLSRLAEKALHFQQHSDV